MTELMPPRAKTRAQSSARPDLRFIIPPLFFHTALRLYLPILPQSPFNRRKMLTIAAICATLTAEALPSAQKHA
jgi:hypothetical protein